LIQCHIGLASNPRLTKEISQAKTKSKKTRGGRGNPPPNKIPNQLSLIQEDDTSVASSVVKTAKAMRPASSSLCSGHKLINLFWLAKYNLVLKTNRGQKVLGHVKIWLG